MEKAISDNGMLIFFMAAVFVMIVAMLYLNTLKSPSLIDLYFENVSEAAGNASFNPDATGLPAAGTGGLENESGLQQAGEPFFGQIEDSVPQGACTPLGNARELLALSTKYMLYYDGEPIYIEFTPRTVSHSSVQFKSAIKSSQMGQVITAESYYTYDLDGNCLQLQVVPGEFAGSVPQKDTILECSGYPLWFVCAEYIDDSIFLGSEAVEMGGRRHTVRKYKSESMELIVGPEEYPILFMYAFTDSDMNKSFSVELIGVEGGGILR